MDAALRRLAAADLVRYVGSGSCSARQLLRLAPTLQTALFEQLVLLAAAFQSIVADDGGNAVGPFSDKNRKKLPAQISSAKPAVVVYQLTTYDWGSRQEQHAAHHKLRPR